MVEQVGLAWLRLIWVGMAMLGQLYNLISFSSHFISFSLSSGFSLRIIFLQYHGYLHLFLLFLFISFSFSFISLPYISLFVSFFPLLYFSLFLPFSTSLLVFVSFSSYSNPQVVFSEFIVYRHFESWLPVSLNFFLVFFSPRYEEQCVLILLCYHCHSRQGQAMFGQVRYSHHLTCLEIFLEGYRSVSVLHPVLWVLSLEMSSVMPFFLSIKIY